MADVARGHRGDCGGDNPGGDPPGGGGWQPQRGCAAIGGPKGKRGKSRNVGTRKMLENADSLLSIRFETGKYNTYMPVGTNRPRFATLVGTLIGRIPLMYESWENVPEEHKTTMFPEIEDMFDMRPWWAREDADEVEKRLNNYFSIRYRDIKWKFKNKYFDKYGGASNPDILGIRPPDMERGVWAKYIKFYTFEDFRKRSTANKGVRAKQKIVSHHGRTSLAKFRDDNRDPETGIEGSPIDGYLRFHAPRGSFDQPDAERFYQEMREKEAQQADAPELLSETDIMLDVLGRRRGWIKGVGPMLSGKMRRGSSSKDKRGGPRKYTDGDVEKMKSSWMKEVMKKMKRHTAPLFEALEKEVNLMKLKKMKMEMKMKMKMTRLKHMRKKVPRIEGLCGCETFGT